MTNPFLHMSTLKPPDEFPFPFSPYSIQKDFMTSLYAVLEERKLGIFESPTGTVSFCHRYSYCSFLVLKIHPIFFILGEIVEPDLWSFTLVM